MKKAILILSLGLLSFSISCKKEVKVEKLDPPKEELLTAHTWRGIKVVRTVEGSSSESTIDIPQWKFIFSSSHDYTFYKTEETIDHYGKWEYISGNSDSVRITPHWDVSGNPGSPYNLVIDKLTEDKFDFSTYVKSSTGIQTRYAHFF